MYSFYTSFIVRYVFIFFFLTSIPIRARIVREPWVDFTLAQHRLFVGQQVQACLRFYYAPHSIEPDSVRLKSPVLPGFSVVLLKKNKKDMATTEYNSNGSVVIADQEYYYSELTWTLCAKEVGKIMIPAYGIYYLPKEKEQRSLWYYFRGYKKPSPVWVYAKPVHVVIEPLPAGDKMVMGVGEFDQFMVSSDHIEVAVGEKIRIVYEVINKKGKGTLLGAYKLDKLPLLVTSQLLSTYQGPVFDDTTSVKEIFEYELEGVVPGRGVVPAQQFVYFNPTLQKYVTLKSSPIEVSVIPESAADQKEQIKTATLPLIADNRLTLALHWPRHPEKERQPLSFWIFFFLMVLIFLRRYVC